MPSYSKTGAPVWNTPTFGEWSFGEYNFGAYQFDGDYEFGAYAFEAMTGVEWGAWDALPGENPDDCLRSQNADHITQISNVITPGATTDGAVIDGAITDGGIADGDIAEGTVSYEAITFGNVVATGAATVSVNGKVLL